MKKLFLTLLLSAVLASLLPLTVTAQEVSGNSCVAYYKYQKAGHNDNPSGIAFIDYGTGKVEEIKYDSCARFINDMMAKGWVLKDTNYLPHIISILMIFEKTN